MVAFVKYYSFTESVNYIFRLFGCTSLLLGLAEVFDWTAIYQYYSVQCNYLYHVLQVSMMQCMVQAHMIADKYGGKTEIATDILQHENCSDFVTDVRNIYFLFKYTYISFSLHSYLNNRSCTCYKRYQDTKPQCYQEGSTCHW